MEERDVQIRGYKVRLPLDLFVVASANPEDYTNRGRIITPLKDRFGSQIRTHYPRRVEHEIAIMEAERTSFVDAGLETREPRVHEADRGRAHPPRPPLARDQPALRRLGARHDLQLREPPVERAQAGDPPRREQVAAPRVSDLAAIVASTSGKIEMETVGDGDRGQGHRQAHAARGAERVQPQLHRRRARRGGGARSRTASRSRSPTPCPRRATCASSARCARCRPRCASSGRSDPAERGRRRRVRAGGPAPQQEAQQGRARPAASARYRGRSEDRRVCLAELLLALGRLPAPRRPRRRRSARRDVRRSPVGRRPGARSARLFQRGAQNPDGARLPGLQDLLKQLRRQRQQQLDRYDLSSALEDIKQKLDEILKTEREGIERRVADAQGAGREGRGPRVLPAGHGAGGRRAPEAARRACRSRPPGASRACRTTSSWIPRRTAVLGADEGRSSSRCCSRSFQGMQQALRQHDAPRTSSACGRCSATSTTCCRTAPRGASRTSRPSSRSGATTSRASRTSTSSSSRSPSRPAQMQSLLASMSPGQRSQLQDMMQSLFMQDERLEAELRQLGMNLSQLMPPPRRRSRYHFRGDDELTMKQAMELMDELQQMDELERQLQKVRDPNDLEKIDPAAGRAAPGRRGRARPRAAARDDQEARGGRLPRAEGRPARADRAGHAQDRRQGPARHLRAAQARPLRRPRARAAGRGRRPHRRRPSPTSSATRSCSTCARR